MFERYQVIPLWAIRIVPYALSAAAIVGGLWWFGSSRYDAGYDKAADKFQAAIDQQKLDAQSKLSDETAKVRDLEAKLSAALANQNQKDATNAKTVSDLTRKLADAGRLRDPKAIGSGRSGSCTNSPDIATTDSGSADAEQAPGLLSAETSQHLRDLAREADEINTAYISCRADAIHLRQLLTASP